MIRIDTATYAESVSCTPRCEIREPIGPIENGTTYIVRPRIAPSNSSRSRARISCGSRQLFVGPASASRCEQMKVRSSTRATSPGSDSARYEFGRLASASFWKVPPSTSVCASWSYSSAVPSHQWISSGCVSAATSSTHPFNRAWLVRTWWRGVVWDMSYHALLGVRIAQLAYPCGWDRRRVAGCQRARRPARWLAKVPEQTLGGPAPAYAVAAAGSRRGTSTTRLKSATSTPSWLNTLVWTRTVPRSGLERDGFTSSTSDSQNRVSPWKTGAGWLSSSVARLAIALPLMSETDIPRASEYTSGPTTTLRPCCERAA